MLECAHEISVLAQRTLNFFSSICLTKQKRDSAFRMASLSSNLLPANADCVFCPAFRALTMTSDQGGGGRTDLAPERLVEASHPEGREEVTHVDHQGDDGDVLLKQSEY